MKLELIATSIVLGAVPIEKTTNYNSYITLNNNTYALTEHYNNIAFDEGDNLKGLYFDNTQNSNISYDNSEQIIYSNENYTISITSYQYFWETMESDLGDIEGFKQYIPISDYYIYDFEISDISETLTNYKYHLLGRNTEWGNGWNFTFGRNYILFDKSYTQNTNTEVINYEDLSDFGIKWIIECNDSVYNNDKIQIWKNSFDSNQYYDPTKTPEYIALNNNYNDIKNNYETLINEFETYKSNYNEETYQQGYLNGQNSVSSQVSWLTTLFSAVIGVPIEILNGLNTFVVFNIPIVTLMISFLMLGIILYIIKRLI